MSVNETNTAQHRWRNQGHEQEQQQAKNYALSGKIMLASIIVLFVVVVFLVLLHLYARWYLLRLQRNSNRRRNHRNRSSRIVFYVDSNRIPSTPTGGLDPSILKSLPLFIYSSKPDTVTPECAVCLSEFETGETGRVLPKCKHSFHTECIDMWFHSHSTCPLCRATVEPVQPVHTCESCEPDVKILIEPGSSGLKDCAEPGSSNVNNTASYDDKKKGIDIRIDVPNRGDLQGETGLRIMSPSQRFMSPRNMLTRILTMSRKSPAVSPSGVGPSFLAPTAESHVELANESTR